MDFHVYIIECDDGSYYVGLAEKLSNALNAKMRVLGFRQEKKRESPMASVEWKSGARLRLVA